MDVQLTHQFNLATFHAPLQSYDRCFERYGVDLEVGLGTYSHTFSKSSHDAYLTHLV